MNKTNEETTHLIGNVQDNNNNDDKNGTTFILLRLKPGISPYHIIAYYIMIFTILLIV